MQTVQLESSAAAPWAFLCANALGGAVPAAGTTRISVRTSEENQNCWGGDRTLEWPSLWNEEMKAEADNVRLALCN